jgi:hypothetical protein
LTLFNGRPDMRSAPAEIDEAVIKATEDAAAAVMSAAADPPSGSAADAGGTSGALGHSAARDAKSGAGDAEARDQGEERPSVWRELRTRLIQQGVVFLAVLLFMWLMGQLPHQQAQKAAQREATLLEGAQDVADAEGFAEDEAAAVIGL